MASDHNINKLNLFKEQWQKMNIQQQFETAVSIIRNLPKDGMYLVFNKYVQCKYIYLSTLILSPKK